MADPAGRAQWPFAGLIFAIRALAFVGGQLLASRFLLIGVGVGVAAALRLALSEDRAGLLVVRGRASTSTPPRRSRRR